MLLSTISNNNSCTLEIIHVYHDIKLSFFSNTRTYKYANNLTPFIVIFARPINMAWTDKIKKSPFAPESYIILHLNKVNYNRGK